MSAISNYRNAQSIAEQAAIEWIQGNGDVTISSLRSKYHISDKLINDNINKMLNIDKDHYETIEFTMCADGERISFMVSTKQAGYLVVEESEDTKVENHYTDRSLAKRKYDELINKKLPLLK